MEKWEAVARANLVAEVVEQEEQGPALRAFPSFGDGPHPHSGAMEEEKIAESLAGEALEPEGQESVAVGGGCLASLTLVWTGSVARRQRRRVGGGTLIK